MTTPSDIAKPTRSRAKRFVEVLFTARWPVVLAVLLAVAVMASAVTDLRFTSNYRIFFSPQNPELLAFEALEQTFSKNDNVLFVVAPSQGSVFEPSVLRAIQSLTEGAWQLPFSVRVDSLTNFQYTYAREDELIVGDLVPEFQALDRQSLQRVRERSLAEPALYGRLLAQQENAAGVNVTIELPRLDDARETALVVGAARKLAADVQNRHPSVEITVSGMLLMNNAFQESARADIVSLVPLSIGLMLLTLLVLTGSFWGTVLTLVVIVLAIAAAMGSGGWLGIPISPPSAVAPIIILTVAIANCVHVLVTYQKALAAGLPAGTAIKQSVALNVQPVCLAGLTTALGFMSMNFSEVPPFRHLGTLVAIGVLVGLVLSLSLFPLLLSLVRVPASARISRQDRAMRRVGNFVIHARRRLLWMSALAVALLVACAPLNQINDVFIHYFDERIEFRRDADYTVDKLTGLYRMHYALASGAEGAVNEPQFLAEVERFAKWYRAQPEVMHVSTLSDIYKRLNQNLHADNPTYYRLPETRDLAAQYLLLFEMSLPFGLDLGNRIDIAKSSTQMVATLKTLSTNEILALEARAQGWLRSNTRYLQNSVGTGAISMFSHIGRRNAVAMIFGTSVALIGISLLLVLALRSLRIGLISLIPNLVPAAMGFGLWGLTVGEVGLSLSVVSSMALGIIVDDTVHFLAKYLRARREDGKSAVEAVGYAFETVARAMWTTSVVLVVGFLVLATSSFELNSGMGLLTAIVIVFALAADFFLLPPLLMLLERRV